MVAASVVVCDVASDHKALSDRALHDATADGQGAGVPMDEGVPHIPVNVSPTDRPSRGGGRRPTRSSVDRVADTDEDRREHGRSRAEQILARADRLPDGDRALLRAIYDTGQSVRDLAPIVGVSARALRRRVQRLVERVLSREFAFVLLQREHWAPTRRRVADAVFIDGLSLRRASRALGLTFHTVRRHHDMIAAAAESSAILARQHKASLHARHEQSTDDDRAPAARTLGGLARANPRTTSPGGGSSGSCGGGGGGGAGSGGHGR